MRVLALIDRTGSMSEKNKIVEAVGAVNAYVEGLPLDTSVYVASFDSQGYDVLRDYKKGLVPAFPITVDEVTPRGWTNLLDSAARVLQRALESAKDEKVVVVFLTDGEENQSRKYSASEVRSMIAECEGRGYQVLFLGANFDGIGKQAEWIGLRTDKWLNVNNPRNLEKTYWGLACATTNYFSGATQDIKFSDADKKAASA